jgi:taurine dioxygenase
MRSHNVNSAAEGSPFKLRPLGPFVGTEVLGADLSRGIDRGAFETLREVLHERGALLFRGQKLTDEEYVRFARMLGDLETHALQKTHIVILSNGIKDGKPMGLSDAGQFWHSDGSYTPQPSMYTVLYGIQIPRDENGEPLGDTLLTNTIAAYESLPAGIKSKLANAQGVFSYDYRYQMRKAANPEIVADPTQYARPDMLHPVFRPHPVTGKRGIYVSEGYVKHLEGVPPLESEPLLKLLLERVSAEEFVYRHRWQEGDVLVWDNNCTQHNAVPNYTLPQVRFMKRIGVKALAQA